MIVDGSNRVFGKIRFGQLGAPDSTVDLSFRQFQCPVAIAGDGITFHQGIKFVVEIFEFQHVRDDSFAVVVEDIVILRNKIVQVRIRDAVLYEYVHHCGIIP